MCKWHRGLPTPTPANATGAAKVYVQAGLCEQVWGLQRWEAPGPAAGAARPCHSHGSLANCNHPQLLEICSLLLNIHLSHWHSLAGSVLLSRTSADFGKCASDSLLSPWVLWLLCLCAVMWLWVPKAGQGPLLSLLSCASGTVLAQCTEELKARRLLTHVSIALLSSGKQWRV